MCALNKAGRRKGLDDQVLLPSWRSGIILYSTMFIPTYVHCSPRFFDLYTYIWFCEKTTSTSQFGNNAVIQELLQIALRDSRSLILFLQIFVLVYQIV